MLKHNIYMFFSNKIIQKYIVNNKHNNRNDNNNKNNKRNKFTSYCMLQSVVHKTKSIFCSHGNVQ